MPLLVSIFRKEIFEGRLTPPLQKPLRAHAIGAVPMKGTTKLRLIEDCSRAESDSLNSYIDPESFPFESLDDAVS